MILIETFLDIYLGILHPSLPYLFMHLPQVAPLFLILFLLFSLLILLLLQPPQLHLLHILLQLIRRLLRPRPILGQLLPLLRLLILLPCVECHVEPLNLLPILRWIMTLQ